MKLSSVKEAILILFTNTYVTRGFLLDSHCIAPSPCTCSSNAISCSSSGLSEVPNFTVHNEHNSKIHINLEYNQFNTIHADAFKNLSLLNATSMQINLAHNHISQIDSGAFAGVESVVTEVLLENNNLTHIPTGLSELTSLSVLYLDANPLTSLDATLMAKFGQTLQTFTLSIDHFPGFPDELHFLSKLTHLTLYHIPFNRLNANVFRGFETSLTRLEIYYSNLEKIPAAICHLKKLQYLTVNNSPNLAKDNSSIFEECGNRINTLRTLMLRNNMLTIFPDVFSLFPSLLFLDLNQNNLMFIKSSSIKYHAPLTAIYLKFNSFTRVPAALNKLASLETLYMPYNQISSVEDFDLQRLHQLRYINLASNPLVYISPVAFKHNPLVYAIYLSGGRLDHIPQAIVGLTGLRYLQISERPIDCSCTEMSNLKSWHVSSISSFTAICNSGETVKTYLTTTLPKCP